MSVIEAMALASRAEHDRECAGRGWPTVDVLGPLAIDYRIVRAALREAERLGFKLVPVEPTEEMAGAVSNEFSSEDRILFMGIWLRGHRAALSAAPGIEEG